MNKHLIDKLLKANEGENMKMTWEHVKIVMKQNDVTDEETQQQLNCTCWMWFVHVCLDYSILHWIKQSRCTCICHMSSSRCHLKHWKWYPFPPASLRRWFFNGCWQSKETLLQMIRIVGAMTIDQWSVPLVTLLGSAWHGMQTNLWKWKACWQLKQLNGIEHEECDCEQTWIGKCRSKNLWFESTVGSVQNPGQDILRTTARCNVRRGEAGSGDVRP